MTNQLHVGNDAQVVDSILAGGDVHVQQTIHQYLQRLVDLPEVPGRMVLVAAHADRVAVKRHAQGMREMGFTVDYDPPSRDPGTELDGSLADAIAKAEHVIVFWSTAARLDPRVAATVRFATDLGDQRHGSALGSGFLSGEELDGTPLPAELSTKPGQVTLTVVFGVLLATAGLGVAATTAELGLPAATPLGWTLLVAALGLSLLAAGFQWLRRPDQLLRAARLHGWATWLDRAKVRDLLQAAERVLDRIYGPQLLSWRALLVSSALSVVFVVPLSITFANATYAGNELGFATISLFGTIPLAMGNIGFDFASLLVTRTVLRWLLRREGAVHYAAGLALDGSLVALCAGGAVVTNLLGWVWFGGEVTGWPLAVVSFAAALGSGGLGLVNAAQDPFAGLQLVTMLAVVTATFPSLWHGALLAVGVVNWLVAHAPLRGIAGVLSRIARSPHGPWTVFVPLTAVLAVLGATSTSAWDDRTHLPSPEDLTAEAWVRVVPAELCPGSCRMGSPDPEQCCLLDQSLGEVKTPAPFDLLATEVPQEVWWSVWDHAQARGIGVLGLARHPSIYVGRRMPVDSVSWCDAARFANLWTLLQAELELEQHGHSALEPVYTSRAATEALEGCEGERVVDVHQDRRGYRLPTEVEWELAARAGTSTAYWSGPDVSDLERVGWVRSNSGVRPHRVGQKPANPLGIYDVHGNLWEWTSTPYVSDEREGPGARRVLRGGSFLNSALGARLANRFRFPPGLRLSNQGFRLVRAPAPQP